MSRKFAEDIAIRCNLDTGLWKISIHAHHSKKD